MPTTCILPLTDTLVAKLATPSTSSTPPIQADVATSRRPLTDTSLLKVDLEVNPAAPATLNVPPTVTLFFRAATFSTVTVDLKVAAPTAVTVLCSWVAPDTVTVLANCAAPPTDKLDCRCAAPATVAVPPT